MTKEELRRQLAEHKALMELNAPETSAPAESSWSGAIYGAPQTYATPPLLNTPPMAGIPLPFPPLMSGFPLGYVIFTSLSLGSHNLPLDHHLPDFLCQASHRMLLLSRQVVPHSHLHPSSLLEYRLLAVVLRVYSPCLRLLHLFPHKQIKANRHQHHLPCLQRQKGARNLPFLALKSGYDSWC